MGSAHAGAPDLTRKILLVFPIFQAIYPRPFQGFAEILIGAGRQAGYRFGVEVIERQPLVTAMNAVGARMVAEDWDAVIVFDDDCFPPVDVIPRLLGRCFNDGLPFVAAAGIMRGYPYTTTAARSYPEGITAQVPTTGTVTLAGFEWLDDLPEDLTAVDFCGLPAAIIHRRCFTDVSPPWFGDLDTHGRRVTHDVYFCKRLRDAGIPIHVDGTLRCGHLVDAPQVTFANRASARAAVSSCS